MKIFNLYQNNGKKQFKFWYKVLIEFLQNICNIKIKKNKFKKKCLKNLFIYFVLQVNKFLMK